MKKPSIKSLTNYNPLTIVNVINIFVKKNIFSIYLCYLLIIRMEVGIKIIIKKWEMKYVFQNL